MKRIVIISMTLALGLIACEDPDERSCIKSIGEEATMEIPLNEFNKIHFGPHLRYVLIQDTVNKIILKGGQNLLNFVGHDIQDGLLTITNDNDCNFLRSYEEVIIAEIHLKKVINLHFEGTHELVTSNTIETDYLTLTIRDGAGAVDLDVNSIELRAAVTNGWGNFKFSGNVGYLNLEIRSNGFGETYGLSVSDSIDVISKTAEDIFVDVEGCQFRAQTISKGNIYYVGTPSSTEFNEYGEGSIIDNN